MAVCSTKHKEIDHDTGHGACSCPMWCNGMPAGFCDKPAYGPQETEQTRYFKWVNGRMHACYVPFLACYAHGGPKQKREG